jgi:hypothetical protein
MPAYLFAISQGVFQDVRPDADLAEPVQVLFFVCFGVLGYQGQVFTNRSKSFDTGYRKIIFLAAIGPGYCRQLV